MPGKNFQSAFVTRWP